MSRPPYDAQANHSLTYDEALALSGLGSRSLRTVSEQLALYDGHRPAPSFSSTGTHPMHRKPLRDTIEPAPGEPARAVATITLASELYPLQPPRYRVCLYKPLSDPEPGCPRMNPIPYPLITTRSLARAKRVARRAVDKYNRAIEALGTAENSPAYRQNRVIR